MSGLLKLSPKLRLVGLALTWMSAIILAALPVVIAYDYGGVLRWTHYAIGLAALAAIVTALPSLTDSADAGGWKRHRLLIPVLAWIIFAWFQTVPLPGAVVSRVSPAAAQAYTDWIGPYLSPQQRPSSYPISVAPFDSRHVLAMLLVLLGVVWASAQVFHSRFKIGWLLCLISIGAAFHVLIGYWRLIYPDSLGFSAIEGAGGQSFGTFVNRNNAALLFNFGLAASLGLLSWRLTAMTGLEVDDPAFEFNDLFSLISHRESAIGVAGAAVCLSGLLVCGSRGGLVAGLAGSLLAFGWVRQRRGFISFPVIGIVIAIAAACLILPFNLDLESLRRFEMSQDVDTSTILRDGRLMHWRDGMEAAIAYLPAGSGFSTYAYAHLPFKQTGPHAWYHHADNLWLELVVEQGIIGIALALLILIIVVRSLNRLGLSHDPLDQGLRTTGWYALGAILVSQAFDFGLIIPANLLVAAVLMSAIVSRDAAVSVPEELEKRKIVFQKRRLETVTLVGAAFSLLAMLLALPVLRRDAEVESAIRSVQARFEAIKFDSSRLQRAADDLSQVAVNNPPPEVLGMLSEIDYRIARMTEVLEAAPKSDEELIAFYLRTGAVPRRLRWRQVDSDEATRSALDPGPEPESTQFYRRSLQTAGETLLTLPLDSVSRSKYVYLDFIHRDPELTGLALRQLRQIYRNNPEMLMRLAVFAADSNETETAIEMWRSALLQEPAFTGRAIGQTQTRREIEFTEVIPDEARNLREAAKHLLAKGIENDSFLANALDGIACESCTSLAERAACEQLAGDIEFKLQRFDEAFASYRSALEQTPANVELRLKLIRRLRDLGKNRESKIEARRGRSLFPEEGRFGAIITEMAEMDLMEIEQDSGTSENASP